MKTLTDNRQTDLLNRDFERLAFGPERRYRIPIASDLEGRRQCFPLMYDV